LNYFIYQNQFSDQGREHFDADLDQSFNFNLNQDKILLLIDVSTSNSGIAEVGNPITDL
jgi:hypothetical protein